MQVEVGRRVAYVVEVVFGVVTSVPCPCAFAVFAVYVAGFVGGFV